jgi:hypothetical protein
MYVAVTLILLGWAISFASQALLVYAIVIAAAFHFRVVLGRSRGSRRNTVLPGRSIRGVFRAGSHPTTIGSLLACVASGRSGSWRWW